MIDCCIDSINHLRFSFCIALMLCCELINLDRSVSMNLSLRGWNTGGSEFCSCPNNRWRRSETRIQARGDVFSFLCPCPSLSAVACGIWHVLSVEQARRTSHRITQTCVRASKTPRYPILSHFYRFLLCSTVRSRLSNHLFSSTPPKGNLDSLGKTSNTDGHAPRRKK